MRNLPLIQNLSPRTHPSLFHTPAADHNPISRSAFLPAQKTFWQRPHRNFCPSGRSPGRLSLSKGQRSKQTRINIPLSGKSLSRRISRSSLIRQLHWSRNVRRCTESEQYTTVRSRCGPSKGSGRNFLFRAEIHRQRVGPGNSKQGIGNNSYIRSLKQLFF